MAPPSHGPPRWRFWLALLVGLPLLALPLTFWLITIAIGSLVAEVATRHPLELGFAAGLVAGGATLWGLYALLRRLDRP